MREIEVSKITDVVEKLCIDANNHLPGDVKCAIENCRACEDGEIACGILDNIIENYNIADRENVPICQTPVWHAFSLKSVRTFTSWAAILPTLSTRAYVAATIRAISASPLLRTPFAAATPAITPPQ